MSTEKRKEVTKEVIMRMVNAMEVVKKMEDAMEVIKKVEDVVKNIKVDATKIQMKVMM